MYKLSSFILFLLMMGGADAQVMLSEQRVLMGSVFEITIVDRDSLSVKKNIQAVAAEVARIEDLISEWKPSSQVSEVNRQAGIQPVNVDSELFELTKRAVLYSTISGGAFDITVAGLDKIWRFDGSMTEKPSAEQIESSIRHIGYQYIVLDSVASTIYLSKPGMKIGFGSIGKGYAADKARAMMTQLHVKGGLVNASGDISTWGKPVGRKSWRIGVNDPMRHPSILKVLKVKASSVATSGSYEKYVEFDNIRYAHIIDPKTGYPATGLVSVTIVGGSVEVANALSTSVMVLGEMAGLALLKKFPTYQYVLITDQGKVIERLW